MRLYSVDMIPAAGGEIQGVMAFCDNVPAAVGCALRLMEEWGEEWFWEPAYGQWEQVAMPRTWTARLDRLAIRISVHQANALPWFRHDPPEWGGRLARSYGGKHDSVCWALCRHRDLNGNLLSGT